MISPANRSIREKLHTRRRELLLHYKRVLALAEEEQQPEIELVDAANEQWDLQVLSRMSDADARTLGNIVEALHRLNAGTYGLCIECDQRIERERLAALPEAARCFECAVDAEHLLKGVGT